MENFLSETFWKNATTEDINSKVLNSIDANTKDKDGRTVLMYAARNNKNPEIVKTLIACGADVNEKKYRTKK